MQCLEAPACVLGHLTMPLGGQCGHASPIMKPLHTGQILPHAPPKVGPYTIEYASIICLNVSNWSLSSSLIAQTPNEEAL